MEHTKTPLSFYKYKDDSGDGRVLDNLGNPLIFPIEEKLGRFIVKACNSHAELVAALEKIIANRCACMSNTDKNWHHEDCHVYIAQQALAKID